MNKGVTKLVNALNKRFSNPEDKVRFLQKLIKLSPDQSKAQETSNALEEAILERKNEV